MEETFKNHKFLIDALNRGDKLAVKYLYDQFYNELCIYARNLTRDDQSSEDIVQNIMVKIWNKKPNLNIKTSIKSYLYKSVYNDFVNLYRLKQKEMSYAEQVKIEALNYFYDEDSEIIDKKIKLVQSEIENLPPKCREAFLLNKVNGLKYREVAEELGISIKTVEAHISKALVRLKKCIEVQKNSINFLLFYK